MKGVMLYYSGSGNTKLACQYVAAKLAVPLDLVDIVRHPEVDLEPYDAVGLATFTDFGAPPQLFLTFLRGLALQQDKLAFVQRPGPSDLHRAIGRKCLRQVG